MKNRFGCTTRLLGSVGLACVFATGAWAQSSGGAAETVVVTGTLIRGVETPTGSNLVTVDADQIKASGTTDAVTLLDQTVSQLQTFNTLQAGSAGYGTPIPKIGLRGFGDTAGNASGATATLLLLNGHRIVPTGILSTDPDASVIPPDMLQSVQVMPDGGSATYGSDAVGGVVNFVTRTSFDGLQAHVDDTIGDGYNEINASLTGGTSWDGGSLVVSVTHDHHNDILGIDRKYVTLNFTPHGGLDNRPTTCPYGNFTVNGTTYVAPGFTPVATLPRCDATNYASIWPTEDRNGVFAYVEQRITSAVKFSMDAFWMDRTDDVYSATEAVPVSLTIGSSNPYFHPVAGETSQTVNFTLDRGIGSSRISPQNFNQFQFSPQLTWDVTGDWQVRLNGIFGQSWAIIHDREGINGGAITPTNVDPYDPSQTSPSVLQTIANWETYSRGINKLASVQLVAEGPVFTLPGGDVHLAVGGEFRSQSLDDTTSQGPIGNGMSFGDFPASRTISAGFLEVLVPFVGDGNRMTLIRELSLDAAVRYDDYSDFGPTTNPRIGLSYKPFDDLVVRGNFQTTFDAPSLADDGDKVDTRLQLLAGSALGLPLPGEYIGLIAGAGANLKPETGQTFSIGADYTPPWLDGFKVGTTYWNTRLQNLVSLSLGAYGTIGTFLTPYNLCGTGFTLPFPPFTTILPASAHGACTPAFVNGLQGKFVRLDTSSTPGIHTVGDLFAPGNNVVAIIDARRNNFGSEKIAGLDFDASYTRDVSFATLTAYVNGTYILNKQISSAPGLPYQNFLSDEVINGQTPRYNVVASLSAVSGPYTATFTVSHNAGYHLPAGVAESQSRVNGFTLANLYLADDLGQVSVLKDNVLSLTISNLFDESPPYYNALATNGYTNGGTLGRTFMIGLVSRY